MGKRAEKIPYNVRLERQVVERIRDIALEGNVSLWIRTVILSELDRLASLDRRYARKRH